jgi:hypothetical protein
VVCNFQNEKNKIKLLTEYENVTQKVSLFIESILQDAKRLQHQQFYIVASGLKFMGLGNPDNNLESLCIYPPILTLALDGDE